tara:strand:+ start:129 stop:824 length:696 start_codon:yes stop_codon:yes gene_type:complete
MKKNKVTAVVIARKGSKRLKGKMYRKFNGKSLINLKISQLLKSKVDEIAVGSDDPRLEKICKKFNSKKIKFYLREKRFCDEISETPNAMIKNMLSFIDTDIVLWAHPTNPTTNHLHFNESLEIFIKNLKKGKDSLYAVSKLNDYFWDHKKKPINHNPLEKTHTLLKLHKIKYIYVDNGAIYIRKHKDMIKDGRFWGTKGFMYIMDDIDGWDINTKWDLDACKLKSFKNKNF